MAVRETTTTYRWPEGSVIQRIDVRQQKNGWAVAYLYADPTENARPQRNDIRAALRLKGLGTLSDSRDGQFVLRVTGLRNGDELTGLMQNHGFVGQPDSMSIAQAASEKPQSFLQRVRSNSLQWSGILATFGNALSISSGIHRSVAGGRMDWGQMGKGLFFGLADLPLMIAGGRDDSRQLTSLLKQLKTHYIKEGIEIPSTASIMVETSDRSKTFGERSMDFMHRYANQIKCSFEVVAAGMGIWAGKAQRSKFKEISPYFWGSGFLASLLIPEKKIDPDKYESAGTLERAWMNIQSNPLSIGGALGYTNNIGDYLSSHAEKKEWNIAAASQKALGHDAPPKLYLWDRTTPSVMLGANGLYFMSKKTVGGGIENEAMVQDAYRIAAQIINKQPEELREKAIESTARFFGDRMEMKEHYTEARQRLIGELDSQRANPWFEQKGLATYVPEPKRTVLSSVRREEVPALAAVPANVIQASDVQQTRVEQPMPAAAHTH